MNLDANIVMNQTKNLTVSLPRSLAKNLNATRASTSKVPPELVNLINLETLAALIDLENQVAPIVQEAQAKQIAQGAIKRKIAGGRFANY